MHFRLVNQIIYGWQQLPNDAYAPLTAHIDVLQGNSQVGAGAKFDNFL